MISQPYYGLTILFAINTINFLDRFSIAAVLSKITDYYEFTNFQSGLLSTCFIFGYMFSAPLFGFLGDKFSRKWIIIGGILFWCSAAFAGSIIGKQHSVLFFISRMLVGVGEASYSTIAPTIIADLFKPDKRKLGLSIFYFAIPIGSGLGFVVGNLALSLGDWRWVFRITPAIGLIAIGFLLLLKEPARGQSDGAAIVTADDSTIQENLVYLMQIRSYVWGTLGFTGCSFALGALSWWGINFMVSATSPSYEKTALMIFGVIVCVAGFAGVIIGSSLAQFFRKYDGRSDPLVCAAGIFIAVPVTILGLSLARSFTTLSWIFLFLSVTALSTNWAIVSDMVLSVTMPNKRAFATAMQILISHLFGDASSPFIIGFLRDELTLALPDAHQAFLYALLTTLIILTLGGLAFLRCAKYFVADVEGCKLMISHETGPRGDRGNDLTDFVASSP